MVRFGLPRALLRRPLSLAPSEGSSTEATPLPTLTRILATQPRKPASASATAPVVCEPVSLRKHTRQAIGFPSRGLACSQAGVGAVSAEIPGAMSIQLSTIRHLDHKYSSVQLLLCRFWAILGAGVCYTALACGSTFLETIRARCSLHGAPPPWVFFAAWQWHHRGPNHRRAPTATPRNQSDPHKQQNPHKSTASVHSCTDIRNNYGRSQAAARSCHGSPARPRRRLPCARRMRWCHEHCAHWRLGCGGGGGGAGLPAAGASVARGTLRSGGRPLNPACAVRAPRCCRWSADHLEQQLIRIQRKGYDGVSLALKSIPSTVGALVQPPTTHARRSRSRASAARARGTLPHTSPPVALADKAASGARMQDRELFADAIHSIGLAYVATVDNYTEPRCAGPSLWA